MPQRLISPTGIELPRAANPRPLPPFNQNPAYQQQPIAPFHLSSVVTLQPGSTGALSGPQLKNPMGQDMEILEIKFEIIGRGVNSVPDYIGVPFGGSVAVNLNLGSFPVTQGAVPLWGFARAENIQGEAKVDSDSEDTYCMYSWRLPRPLFVPAGALLKPELTHLGYVGIPLTIRVGYSARTCLKPPRTVAVPFVSGYASKVFNPLTVSSSDSSQPQQLFNDTGKQFKLQRFTGRTLWFAKSADVNFVSEALLNGFGSRFLTMRMTDSYGRPIVRTFTPFRSVFGDLTRSWELEEVGAELDPGAYYRVFLKKDAMAINTDYAASMAQAFVTMVGWREEAA